MVLMLVEVMQLHSYKYGTVYTPQFQGGEIMLWFVDFDVRILKVLN